MHKSIWLTVVISVTALLPGCSKQKVETPLPQAGTPAPSPELKSVVPDAPPADAAPVAGPAVTTKASNDAAYINEMSQTLNEFLGDWVRANHRIPKDINEMLTLKIITSVPALPGTKRWVIDQQTGKISAK